MSARNDDKDELITSDMHTTHNFEADIVLEKFDQDHEKVKIHYSIDATTITQN